MKEIKVQKKFQPAFPNEPFDSSNPAKAFNFNPPKPETCKEVAIDEVDNFLRNAKAVYDKGAWQTDASTHARSKFVGPETVRDGTTLLEAKPGNRVLRLAYFFLKKYETE